MKKVISVIILLVMALSLFTGCQESYDLNKLYTDLPSEEAFLEMYIALSEKDYYVDLRKFPERRPHGELYYGTINGYIVASETTGDLGIGSTFDIAGYTFESGLMFDIFVYKDGEGDTLKEAYEKGWLTKEQIGKIYERHPKTGDERLQMIEEYQ